MAMAGQGVVPGIGSEGVIHYLLYSEIWLTGMKGTGQVAAMEGLDVVLREASEGMISSNIYKKEKILTVRKAVGISVVRAGLGVMRQEIPAGKPTSEVGLERILMDIIASENAAGLRRCRRCRRYKPAGDYDHNAQRRLLLACRLCLVYYPIP